MYEPPVGTGTIVNVDEEGVDKAFNPDDFSFNTDSSHQNENYKADEEESEEEGAEEDAEDDTTEYYDSKFGNYKVPREDQWSNLAFVGPLFDFMSGATLKESGLVKAAAESAFAAGEDFYQTAAATKEHLATPEGTRHGRVISRVLSDNPIFQFVRGTSQALDLGNSISDWARGKSEEAYGGAAETTAVSTETADSPTEEPTEEPTDWDDFYLRYSRRTAAADWEELPDNYSREEHEREIARPQGSFMDDDKWYDERYDSSGKKRSREDIIRRQRAEGYGVDNTYPSDSPTEEAEAPVIDKASERPYKKAAEAYIGPMQKVESFGGKSDASNPISSAYGASQFTKGTWMGMIKKYRPDLMEGKTKEEVLALRSNYKLDYEMVVRFTEENAAKLDRLGYELTKRNLYLMHFAGPTAAPKLLKASEGDKAIDHVSPAAHKGNPSVFYYGKRKKDKKGDTVYYYEGKQKYPVWIHAHNPPKYKSVKEVLDWAENKMG